MQTAIDRLGAPYALTIGDIIDQSDADFALYLRDRRNARRIPIGSKPAAMSPCATTVPKPDAGKSGAVTWRSMPSRPCQSATVSPRLREWQGCAEYPASARSARSARFSHVLFFLPLTRVLRTFYEQMFIYINKGGF